MFTILLSSLLSPAQDLLLSEYPIARLLVANVIDPVFKLNNSRLLITPAPLFVKNTLPTVSKEPTKRRLVIPVASVDVPMNLESEVTSNNHLP